MSRASRCNVKQLCDPPLTLADAYALARGVQRAHVRAHHQAAAEADPVARLGLVAIIGAQDDVHGARQGTAGDLRSGKVVGGRPCVTCGAREGGLPGRSALPPLQLVAVQASVLLGHQAARRMPPFGAGGVFRRETQMAVGCHNVESDLARYAPANLSHLTSSTFSCTLTRCQSTNTLSSRSRDHLFLQTRLVTQSTRSARHQKSRAGWVAGWLLFICWA